MTLKIAKLFRKKYELLRQIIGLRKKYPQYVCYMQNWDNIQYKVRKKADISYRYEQVPHPIQDITWESD